MALTQVTAWRVKTESQNDILYRLQVHGTNSKRIINKVLKVTKHWDQVAEGMNYKKKEFILIFSRKFSNESSWKKWVKSFPFQLSELSRTGKLKTIN